MHLIKIKTVKSNEVDFTVKATDPGNYLRVTIGSQTWMLKNLDVDHYRNGDVIPMITDNQAWSDAKTGAWCYFNNDPAMGAKYGNLYNWYAVMDVRGLAPSGWHVASNDEWHTLYYYFGGYNKGVGGILKETDTTHWKSPNVGATNQSGFTALPGNNRDTYGKFSDGFYSQGFWWTSSVTPDGLEAWSWMVASYSPEVYFQADGKNIGYSVRCIMN